MKSTSPVISPIVEDPEPLKGMCVQRMPAIDWSNSPGRWVPLPVPDEP
jgi:hypothetical protein